MVGSLTGIIDDKMYLHGTEEAIVPNTHHHRCCANTNLLHLALRAVAYNRPRFIRAQYAHSQSIGK